MKKFFLSCLTVALISIYSIAWAEADLSLDDTQKLINNWLNAAKESNITKDGNSAKYGDFLAPEFVIIHSDGMIRNKTQSMEYVKKDLHLKSFELNNFKITKSGDIIIVTYTNKASEIIDNKHTSNEPKPRMTILQKQGDRWLILAHADLDPLNNE